MRTRKWIQASILLFMGLYFLDNMLSGKINLYINSDRFAWLSWIGTALFLLLGVMSVIDLIREKPDTETDQHDHEGHDHAAHDHGHDHSHEQAPSWFKLILVGIPLMVGLLVPAKPLGAAAVSNGGISTSFSSAQNSPTSFNIAPADRTVLDWVRAFNESSDVKQFAGQTADVTGFVYRDIRFDGKPQLMVARFVISCCVADASAIGVIVQTADAAKWPQDGWVHVTGKFTTQTIDGRDTPVVLADSITPATQPEHPYLYP